RVLDHPLPHWVEVMTTAYLHSAECVVRGAQERKPGAEIIRREGRHNIWQLIWPDGYEQVGCFTTHNALRTSHLGLEDPHIRGLVTSLPRFAPRQPIPSLRLSGLPGDVQGTWSLWQIAISGVDWNRQRIMPLFQHGDGRIFVPTARRVWERLLEDLPEVHEY